MGIFFIYSGGLIRKQKKTLTRGCDKPKTARNETIMVVDIHGIDKKYNTIYINPLWMGKLNMKSERL